jgi:branched-chain amino acid transport system substrate-binding protein
MLKNRGWIVALATVVLSVGSAQAQIKVGITMSGSGPGAALGQPQTKTVAALPKEIAGQKITYFALDDESDPTKGAQNARKLITEEKVDDPGEPADDRYRRRSQDAPALARRRRRSGGADG